MKTLVLAFACTYALFASQAGAQQLARDASPSSLQATASPVSPAATESPSSLPVATPSSSIGTPSPSITPSPKSSGKPVAPLPLPTACNPSFDGIDFQTAFGADVDDFPLLRFVALLASDAGYSERAMRAKALPDATADAVFGAANAACRGPIASVAALRAMILAGDVNSSFESSKAADTALYASLLATSALAARSRIDADTLAATLAPFGITPDQLIEPGDIDASAPAASPSPVPKGDKSLHVLGSVRAITCTSDPTPNKKRTPSYPSVARASRVTGIIIVALHFDEIGFPRYSRLYSSTAGDDAAGSALVRAAMLSANGTTYKAEDDRCSIKPATYLFVAQFAAS